MMYTTPRPRPSTRGRHGTGHRACMQHAACSMHHASCIILGILIHTIYIYNRVIYDVIHEHDTPTRPRPIDGSMDGWIDRSMDRWMRWDGAFRSIHSSTRVRRGRSRALDVFVVVVFIGLVSRSMASRRTTIADDAWETTRGWRRHPIPRHRRDE